MTDISVKAGGFTPEIWSNKININLDNYGKYNDIVNRKYEGEIKQKGDKVYFYTYGNLTVRNYTPNATSFSGLTFEDPTGTKLALEVDQEKYIAFQIDKVDDTQSNVDLVNGFTKRMAIAFAQTKDLYIHGLAVANASTKMNSSSGVSITDENVWAQICNMYAALAAKNAIVDGVDYQGKRPALVITPAFEGIMKQCKQFYANAFGNETLRKGQIGHIGGFDVFVDTNIPTTKSGTGTSAYYYQNIVALTSDAITFAEQITETDIVKAENSFHKKVKSLHVYGGKVANPDCIVTNKIKISGLGSNGIVSA